MVIFMVMTLLFHKSNFCGNFITFLEVSKLLITNYFSCVTYRQGADHKKCLQLKQVCDVYQLCISSECVCDDVAVLALSRSNT